MEIVIIYMKRKVVQIIGGSASTAYALDEGQLPWPELFAKRNPQFLVSHSPRAGLSFVQSFDCLNEVEFCDILILHFGTSTAWPRSLIKFSFSFHQPPKIYVGDVRYKISKNLKLRVRNIIKYVLFFAGLYRPVTSFREIQDQVSAVSKIALSKAHKVVWIQHQSIHTSRIVLERSLYRRYYREIIDALSPLISENFRVLQLPKNFLRADNFLLDGVHLTAQGHKELAELIEEKFGGLLSDD